MDKVERHGKAIINGQEVAFRSECGDYPVKNESVSEDYPIDVILDSGKAAAVEGMILTGEMHEHNTFDNPEQVKCTSFDDVKLTDDGLKLTLPKCSVLHLTVTVK